LRGKRGKNKGVKAGCSQYNNGRIDGYFAIVAFSFPVNIRVNGEGRKISTLLPPADSLICLKHFINEEVVVRTICIEIK
jgi:hypothetical protein